MKKKVGYFEGTDSGLLTSLICEGYDTIPLSNGLDNHGKHIGLVNEETRLDLIVGYVHKIVAPENVEMSAHDIIHLCSTYAMPLLLLAPQSLHNAARKLLQNPPDIVKLVDPAQVVKEALAILKG